MAQGLLRHPHGRASTPQDAEQPGPPAAASRTGPFRFAAPTRFELAFPP